MPLIKCPDCAESVSDRAEVCPKCARPIVNSLRRYGVKSPVQTIEKTSKKLKAGVLVSYGVFFASIFLMLLGGASDSNNMMVLGLLGFVAGGFGMGAAKLKIWWEHE